MHIYLFDPETGKYIGMKEPVLDSINSEIKGSPVYRLEASSTFSKPSFVDGFTPYYDGNEWKNIPNPSTEELAIQSLNDAKTERKNAVDEITVEVDGMVFDGDEISQQRMARAVVMFNSNNLTDDTKTVWVLADNTIAEVTVEQLSKALLLAGQKQTELWTKPYEND